MKTITRSCAKDRFTIPLAWIAVGAVLILGQIAAFNGVFDSPRYEMSEGSR